MTKTLARKLPPAGHCHRPRASRHAFGPSPPRLLTAPGPQWTPLSFRYLGRNRISISLGSLDHPSRVPPAKQYGIESRLAFVATLTNLPATRTEDEVAPQDLARLESR